MFKKEKDTLYPLPDIVGINLPNVWQVGYGLDDNNEKRGWKHLFAVPKTEDVVKHEHDQLFDDENYYNNVRKNIKIYIDDIIYKNASQIMKNGNY
jgi:hypothetical protein